MDMQDRIVYSKENKIVIRNDLMISNWALILYILYMLQIINVSPLPIMIFAFTVATTSVLIGIYYQNISINNFLAYVFMTFFLKLIPIWSLKHTRITKNVLMFSMMILILYLLYLDINNTSFLSVYRALTNNNPTQLGIYYMQIAKFLQNLIFS